MLKACNWQSIYHMITIHSTTLMHNIITQKTPESLYGMLTSYMQDTDTHRQARKIRMTHHAQSDQLNNSFMYKTISIYNSFPITLLELNSKAFKTQVKTYITSTHRPDRIPERIT